VRTPLLQLAVLVALTTCSGSASTPVAGAEGATCLADGACNEGLVCVSSKICLQDPCEGVACSGHGTCAVAGGSTPVCACNDGFHADALNCVANVTTGLDAGRAEPDAGVAPGIDAGQAEPDAGHNPGEDASTPGEDASTPGEDAGLSGDDAGTTITCAWGGAPGVCISLADCAALGDHTSYSGKCPGPTDIQCCIVTPSVADNPPVPAGYKLMQQSEVTPEMTTWAVAILNDPVTYPMFSMTTKTFGTLTVLARVEWHPPDFQNGAVHRGVTLYEPV
jgi:hypothetical protein